MRFKGIAIFLLVFMGIVASYFVFDSIIESTSPGKRAYDEPHSGNMIFSQSPYEELFDTIIPLADYNKGYAYFSERYYLKMYLWDAISKNETYKCPSPGDEDEMIDYISSTVNEYYSKVQEANLERDTVKMLLLIDMDRRVSAIQALINARSLRESPSLRLAYSDACLIRNRLDNLDNYSILARSILGDPGFSYDDLLAMLGRTGPHVDKELFRNVSPYETRKVLKHLVYRLISNESLLNQKLAQGFDLNETASLLLEFNKNISDNPYLESLFKPALAYLVSLRYEDIRGHRSEAPPVRVDEFYLRVFQAWYNIVKPWKLVGGVS